MKKIAVVGMACKFPDGANSLNEYWQLMVEKRDAIDQIPKDRWDTRKFYSKHDGKPGKSCVKEAGFIDTSIYDFDPLFFGITPREAECMDPQQRQLLQITWGAIEDSGMSLEALQKKKTGVFVGCFTLGNMLTQLGILEINQADGSTPTASTMAIVANRISHALNLKGPSVAMDTACSSSLVSTHVACQSIFSGESDIAVAAGVNIMTRPEYPTIMSKGKFLSKHGRCKTFSEDASGYTRGEGVGVVILKLLEKAIEDGDRIYSVISASGVNQDGATVGMASPNGEAQESLIRSVYKKAQVHPNEVQYVEAHGTGTQVGDKTETGVLGKIFREKTNGKICVGSVKTNIGHLEAAAGIASLIKTSLCIYKSKLVPNLHFSKPSSKIDFDQENIEVVTENQDWPSLEAGALRRASINSFGYGGTNAHLLLESAPLKLEDEKISESKKGKPYLINISTRDENALRELAGSLVSFIDSNSEVSLAMLSYNLLKRRSSLSHNFSFWATSIKEVSAVLSSFEKEGMLEKGACEEVTKTESSKVAFVFTGMGPQWQGMGKELYKNNLVFRSTLDKCDAVFKKLTDISPLEELLKDESESRMSETAVAQPANFLIQIGLFECLKVMGHSPDGFVGHSVGEVASAYGAGMLSLEDAVLVSYHRSRLQQTLSGKGTMLALGLSEEEAKGMIKTFDHVDIAAINSSDMVTLSGDVHVLKQVEAMALENKIFCKFLRVEVAYHSYQMDDIKDSVLDSLSKLKPEMPKSDLYSTVTGQNTTSGWGHEYWWSNVRSPVSFSKTIKNMIHDGYDHFIEVGPHPVLKTSLEGLFKEMNARAFRTQTLNRKEKEFIAIENTSSWLSAHGFRPLEESSFEEKQLFLSLPSYPWQNEEYRRETRNTKEYLRGSEGNIFLYKETDDIQPAWEVEFNEGFFPFVEDHVVQNNVVFPGACYIEAGLAVAHKIKGDGDILALEDLNFSNMLVANNKEIQILKMDYLSNTSTFSVHSRLEEDDFSWKQHAKGKVLFYEKLKAESRDLDAVKRDCSTEIEVEVLYNKLASVGLEYGPYFRGIVELYKSERMVFSKIKANEDLEWDDNFYLQPAMMDACFQSMIALVDLNSVGASFVPVHVEQIQFFEKPGLEFNSLVEVHTLNSKEIVGDISILDNRGQVLVLLKGVRCKAIASQQDKMTTEQLTYKIDWVEKEREKSEKIQKGDLLESVLVLFEKEDEAIRKADWGQHFEILQLSLTKESFSFPTSLSRVIYFFNDTSVESKDRYEILRSILADKNTSLTHIDIITTDAAFVDGGEKQVDCDSGAMASLHQVIANEYPSIFCRSIDMTSSYVVSELLQEIISDNCDHDVAFRGEKRFVQEINHLLVEEDEADSSLKTAHEAKYTLFIRKPGRVDELKYEEVEDKAPQANEVRIKTLTSALNFKDLLKVYGQISEDVVRGTFYGETIGMELCGEIVEVGEDIIDFKVGEKVILPTQGSFTTYVTAGTDYLIKLPSSLSEEQAPVLLGYITAYHGFCNIARLQKGEKVLIHNGTGGMGIPAIQVAQWLGADIYTTAGTEAKRAYLRELGIKHVYDSRSLDFSHEIKRDTDGYGVDVVLNALSGQALEKSFNLLAPYGRFIEIGKKDIGENSGLAMKAFNQSLQFSSFDFDRMLENRIELYKNIHSEISERFACGDFHAIPVKVFKADQTKDAFTFMAQSKHVGKVVIDYRNSEIEVIETIEPLAKKKGLVIVTGGAGGFGFQVSKYLAEKTGYHVVGVSRSGVKDSNDQKELNLIKKKGLQLDIATLDVSDKEAVFKTIADLEEQHGELKGVVHSAAVLDDGFIKDLDVDRFSKVLDVKINGAKNIADYGLKNNKELDFFVSFSSISSLIGNPGQANYVVANRFLDLFSADLRLKGINAYTINWGVLGESGMLSRDESVGKLLERSGIKALTNQVALAHFYQVICGGFSQTGVFDIDWSKWASSFKSLSETSKFKNIVNSSDSFENPLKTALMKELNSLSEEEMNEYLLLKIKEGFSSILKLSADKIASDVSVNKLGVDSLMSVEVLGMIETDFFVGLSTVDLLNGPTIQELAMIIKSRLFGEI